MEITLRDVVRHGFALRLRCFEVSGVDPQQQWRSTCGATHLLKVTIDGRRPADAGLAWEPGQLRVLRYSARQGHRVRYPRKKPTRLSAARFLDRSKILAVKAISTKNTRSIRTLL